MARVERNHAAARSDVVHRRLRLERTRRPHGRARAQPRAIAIARSISFGDSAAPEYAVLVRVFEFQPVRGRRSVLDVKRGVPSAGRRVLRPRIGEDDAAVFDVARSDDVSQEERNAVRHEGGCGLSIQSRRLELPATNNGARGRVETRVAATRLDRAFRYVPFVIDDILYGNDTLL